MGFKSSEWAYNVPNLTAPERAVLVALAHCRNDKSGACFPGQDTLVEMTGLSEKTVRRALASLDSRDLPVIERAPRFAGRYRTSDSYVLLFDNYRSDRPPVTVTTGQSDHRSESPSPPVTVSLTTGHSDHPIEEEQEAEQEVDQEVSSSPSARDLVKDFDRAYANWPKKVEKKRSLAAFVRAAKTLDAQELVADIIRHGNAFAATTEKKFVPALSKWLADERWTDDLPTAGAQSKLTPTQRAQQTLAAGGLSWARQREQNTLALVEGYRALEDAENGGFPPGHIPTDAEWAQLTSDPAPQRPSTMSPRILDCGDHTWLPDGTCTRCEVRRERGAA